MKPATTSTASIEASSGLRSFRHFPFPQPEMPGAHTHNDIELNFVVEGAITYRFGSSQTTFQAGSVYVFWATIPHFIIQHATDTHFFAVHLPVANFLQWRLPTRITQRTLRGDLLVFPRSEDADFCALLCEQIHKHIQSGDRAEKAIALLEIEAWLRTLALSTQPTQPEPVSGQLGNDSVEQMISLIIRDFRESLNVAQIAAVVHLHPNYAMQLFRKCTGRTIVAYLTQYRVAHAQQLLLTTDQSISEIALACGFNSLSRFYAAFREICNDSPKHYRQSLREAREVREWGE
ncbi:MAG: helix-turn-helix domain-containing protein [Caldilineaceae bacterium]|nr:helix-turn-helix domain-containing protein [Caldilineaceae bacterium]HRJ42863.1 helix-turn-helix domain-containing protein [Caldilineaceae bacterium]